jgi:hypothetical protein
MSQLCRVNQDPDEISSLLGVIEMKELSGAVQKLIIPVLTVLLHLKRLKEGEKLHLPAKRGYIICSYAYIYCK